MPSSRLDQWAGSQELVFFDNFTEVSSAPQVTWKCKEWRLTNVSSTFNHPIGSLPVGAERPVVELRGGHVNLGFVLMHREVPLVPRVVVDPCQNLHTSINCPKDVPKVSWTSILNQKWNKCCVKSFINMLIITWVHLVFGLFPISVCFDRNELWNLDW